MQDINKLKEKDYFTNLGYSLIGPLLLQFCYWVYKDIKNKKINDIYFLSRDGYLPYEAFKMIFGNDKKINTTYLHISRRANAMNLCFKKNQKHIEKKQLDYLSSIVFDENLSVRDSLKLLNLDIKKHKDLAKNIDINITTPLKTRANLNIARATILPILHKEILPQLRTTQTNFIKYLNNQELSENNKKPIAIIDGTSSGRTQRCLFNYKISPYIHGYYFFINRACKLNKNRLNSFLLHGKKCDRLIEQFISSCKASLSHIEINNGIAKPVFTPVVLDKVTSAKFKSLREGSLKFITDYNKLFGKDRKIEMDRLYFSNKIAKLIMQPSKEDAINLGSCMIDKYYGSDSSRKNFIEFPKKGGVLQAYKFYKLNDWKHGYYKLLPIKYKFLIFPIHFFKQLKYYYIPRYLISIKQKNKNYKK